MENVKSAFGAAYPRTFEERDEWFRAEAGCRDYIRRLRWPGGFVCGCCGVIGEPWVMARGVFRCESC
ncbi:MAG: transposase, partial [Methylocella sp.]